MSKDKEKTVNFPIDKMSLWRDTLEEYANVYGSLYAVSDTETTSNTVISKVTGLFERVLEWSICFCYKDKDGYLREIKDENGELIVLNEPMNPFLSVDKKMPKQKLSVKDIHPESIEVHGITLDYVFGVSGGEFNRPKLKSVAPTFEAVLETCLSLLDFNSYKFADIVVYLVFHNAPFDVRFLNSECDMYGLPKIESFFGVIDTQDLCAQILSVNRMSLDSLYSFGKENYPELIEKVERPFHSSLIDSCILIQAYNVLNKHYITTQN